MTNLVSKLVLPQYDGRGNLGVLVESLRGVYVMPITEGGLKRPGQAGPTSFEASKVLKMSCT